MADDPVSPPPLAAEGFHGSLPTLQAVSEAMLLPLSVNVVPPTDSTLGE